MTESTADAAVFGVGKAFGDSEPGLVRLNGEHHATGDALEPIRVERVEEGERLMPRRAPQAHGRVFSAGCPAIRGAARPRGGRAGHTRYPSSNGLRRLAHDRDSSVDWSRDGCETQIPSKTAVK